MDFHTLELFADLSRTLRFRATSRRCHLTPSALSRAISRLEGELGERLLDRDRRRSVRLTAAGVRFRDYAERALAEWRAYRAGAAGELQGELSIYCSATASYAILPPILTRLRREHPQVSIFLRTGDVEAGVGRVSEGEADLALVVLPERPPKQLVFAPVLETPLVFVAPAGEGAVSRELAKKRVDWEAVPLVLPETGLARREVAEWFRKRKLRPNVYAYASGNEALMSMVSLGLGVGVVPKIVADHRPAVIRLRYLEEAPKLKPYVAAVCARRSALGTPLVKAAFGLASGGARR